jgi:tripartite-type tricarboxylate transporter receptor subunit TctC
MNRRLLLALGGCSLARGAFAQTAWPTRPITLVVPFAPGGIADLTARTVAQSMGRSLGTAIVVDNRPSAGSVVASTAVAKAAPDGYTLLLMSNANAVSTGLFRSCRSTSSRTSHRSRPWASSTSACSSPPLHRCARSATRSHARRRNPGA